MMRREKFTIANIYVPIKRRATLKPEIVQEIAQSMLEVGQQAPVLVRRDIILGIERVKVLLKLLVGRDAGIDSAANCLC